MAALSALKAFEALNNPDFRGRCIAIAFRASLTVYGENPATAGHAARAAFCTKMLNDPDGYTTRITLLAATNIDIADPTNPISATDAQILTALALGFNAIAGA